MLGTIIGIGAAAGKAIANNNAKNEQKKENRELMKYQADLNQQQAYYSTGLAKDLWDYTNYENTIKHIKAAGLSPSLIYGGGGGGGSTSGGGQASGVGMPSKTGTEAGIQAQGMALQLANVASQTRLNESQADKNEAEAEKTRGVDTKAQEATIDNLIAQTSNEKVKKGLILGQIRVADAEEELKRNMADWTKDKADETRWNIKSLQKGIDKLTEEINGMKLDNELKERTIDNKAIKGNYEESRKEWLLKQLETKEGYSLWRGDNKPIELWSNAVITQKLNYIHQNPVEEGLVFKAEDYMYSSAYDYTGENGMIDILVID